jgi:hypothetical protein
MPEHMTMYAKYRLDQRQDIIVGVCAYCHRCSISSYRPVIRRGFVDDCDRADQVAEYMNQIAEGGQVDRS